MFNDTLYVCYDQSEINAILNSQICLAIGSILNE